MSVHNSGTHCHWQLPTDLLPPFLGTATRPFPARAGRLVKGVAKGFVRMACRFDNDNHSAVDPQWIPVVTMVSICFNGMMSNTMSNDFNDLRGTPGTCLEEMNRNDSYSFELWSHLLVEIAAPENRFVQCIEAGWQLAPTKGPKIKLKKHGTSRPWLEICGAPVLQFWLRTL
jgi:hypothetical protein